VSEYAIRVRDLRKEFVLPHERHSSLKAVLMRTRDRGYEMQHVLRGVTLDIAKGEFFGIVGRNGSGKSTLLKLLAGIYQPTSGAVERHGALVPLIELGVGFNPELTGRENVYLNGAMLGFSRRRVQEIYDDVVEFADLEPFMDQKLKNYSSGMQVRLAFSIATRAEADILLIDEVLAVGDADFQRKCLAYFREVKASGTTVVFVSHDMDAVRKFCDRAVLVENGELVAHGTPDEVADAYAHLFMPPEEAASDGRRFGTGAVTMRDAEAPAELTEADADLVITTTLVPADGFGGRVRAGFLVRDADGAPVFGTSGATATQSRQYDLDLDVPTTIRWRVANILNDGDYTVTLTVTDPDSGSVLEEWNDAARFAVRRVPRTANLVVPPITLDVV